MGRMHWLRRLSTCTVDIYLSDVVDTLWTLLTTTLADTLSDLFTLQVRKNKKLLKAVLNHAMTQDSDEELQMIIMLACQGYVRFKPTDATTKACEYLQSKSIVMLVDRETEININADTYHSLFSTGKEPSEKHDCKINRELDSPAARANVIAATEDGQKEDTKSEVVAAASTSIPAVKVCQEEDDFKSAVTIHQPSTRWWYEEAKSPKFLYDLALVIAKQSYRILLGSLLHEKASSTAIKNARMKLLQGNMERKALLDKCFVGG